MTWSRSTYDPLPPVLDMEAALADGATLVHPDLGTNENATWVFDSGAAGTGASVDEAIAAAEADPDSVVVRRRFRQQRLIPAFMEPRSCVVDPTGEQMTIYAATQIPHILRTMTTVTMGVPESKVRVIAPDVGGGFGGKIGVLPEEMLCVAGRPEARQAGQVDRDPLRVTVGRPPRSGPDPGPRADGEEGRHPHRLRRPPPRRHGRLPRPCRPRRADPRRLHVQRDLQDPGAEVHLHQRLHHEDASPTPTAARAAPRRRSPSSG